MIPLNLTLRNFMSYGEEPVSVEFAGMHVACLSGDNGNGKSALLDAITYALWGKTRASGSQSSSDDDLVRLGAEQMEVSLEFRMGEQVYRSSRRRNRRTRTGDWQVEAADGEGGWAPVGAGGIRDAERTLARILHMEYETFLNSAYIQQGRADEFTRQKPNERKRILADILALSRYDRLEQMAKERRNEADLALRDLEGEVRHLEARVQEAPSLQARLTELDAARQEAEAARAASAERSEESGRALAVLAERELQLADHRRRLGDYEHETREGSARLERLCAELAEDARLFEERTELLRRRDLLTTIREALQRMAPALQELEGALRERIEAEAELARERQALALELAHAREAAGRYAADARRARELGHQRDELAAALGTARTQAAALEVAQQRLLAAQEHFASLSAKARQLKEQRAETAEVVALLSAPTSICPVCESDLRGGKLQAVLERQQARLAEQGAELHALNREGAEAKATRERMKLEVARAEEQAAEARAMEARGAELDRALAELAGAEERAAEAARAAEALAGREERGDYGAQARARLAALDDRIGQLRQQTAKHAELRREHDAVLASGLERKLARLEEAEAAAERLAGEKARLEASLAKRRDIAERERERIAAAEREIAGSAALRTQAEKDAQSLAEAAARHEQALAQVARVKQALDDCARATEQLAARKARHDALAADRRAFTDLAAAFGKKGVQALIIDTVLPEIEEEANRLLARMTENGMRVELSTVKSARSGGGQIETLDIHITDDSGTRPYEMFSGGEAFRINFAIRIALSRLLTGRAGARLQTLIIDEGFGTQDARGRERIVEAIEAVRDEFALILVISHVEELKDAFGTRIEITRTESGSQVAVMG